jgi:uncharacterized protein YfaS (alpha-2-macroglobulin family)
LVEAEKLGYHVPAAMRSGWLSYQQSAANAWRTTGSASSVLDQSYRLYTMALAGQPDFGAMNRLRESSNLTIAARWMLAAAYSLAGMNDAVGAIIRDHRIESATQIKEYTYPDDTFGSRLRDQAIVLAAMVSMRRADEAQPLVRALSDSLSSQSWYSTQSLAYSLLAISKFAGANLGDSSEFVYSFDHEFGGKRVSARSDSPLNSIALGAVADAGTPLVVKNTSKRVLFVTAVTRGVEPPGSGTASASGLALDIDYADKDGNALDVTRLVSGTDLVARITVRNNEPFQVKNIALTFLTPAGWEIMNDRLDNVATQGERAGGPRYWNDWYYALYTRAQERTEFLDIRDDRVNRYFALQTGEQITFVTRLNAAYLGRFWMPGVHVEAMYDAARNASTAGRWVVVSERGK